MRDRGSSASRQLLALHGSRADKFLAATERALVAMATSNAQKPTMGLIGRNSADIGAENSG